MLLREGKYTKKENREKINDKLISKRTKKDLFVYVSRDLNKRYVHGLFNEFEALTLYLL